MRHGLDQPQSSGSVLSFHPSQGKSELRTPDQANDVLIDRHAKAEVKRMGKRLERAASEVSSMTAGERR